MANEWIVDKATLVAAVKILNLVPARPGILSSEFFQIQAKGGTAKFAIASEIKGEYEIKGKGLWPFEKNFYLDRRVFVPFVLQAATVRTDSPFHFYANGKSLVLRHGKRKAQFDGQPALKGYGFEAEELTKKVRSRLELTEHAKFLIRCAMNCAQNDHSTPHVQCVYVQPNGSTVNIYATNGKLMYQAKSKDKIKPPIPIPFPLFLVGLLEHEELIEAQWKESYVTLIFKHGQIWQPVSASAKTKFPHSTIDFYVKKSAKHPALFVASTKKFSAIISRLGQYLGAVRRQDWMLVIEGNKGSKDILLTSEVPQTVFKEKLTLESELKQSFKIYWPLDMLVPVFEFLKPKDKGEMSVRLMKDCSYVSTTDINLVIPGVEG